MAFFEDLGKKITQTSQGVVQKTKDTAEVIKLNGMVSDEEKNINNIYAQIGKMFYEKHADTCEEPFAGMVAAIKESQTKKEQYSEQIKRLKGVVRCSNCGGDVQYGAPFCSSCGSKMSQNNNTFSGNDSTVNRCQNCGMPINQGCGFCTNCGAKAIIASNNTAATNIPALNRDTKCQNCGAEIGNNTFCTNCGAKKSADSETEECPVVEQPIQRTCPNCKNTIDEDSAFCMNCGAKL